VIELNFAFFVQLVNFGILVLVLNTFLYKPIRKILSDRRQVVESARSKAVSVDQEVQEKMALYEARLRDAKAEAADRRTSALKQAQIQETSILEKARTEAAGSLAAIRDRVARESADAKVVLKGQVEALSGEICEKILGRSL
jgi:F-type H+-transporting ATPase subunit b